MLTIHDLLYAPLRCIVTFAFILLYTGWTLKTVYYTQRALYSVPYTVIPTSNDFCHVLGNFHFGVVWPNSHIRKLRKLRLENTPLFPEDGISSFTPKTRVIVIRGGVMCYV